MLDRLRQRLLDNEPTACPGAKLHAPLALAGAGTTYDASGALCTGMRVHVSPHV